MKSWFGYLVITICALAAIALILSRPSIPDAIEMEIPDDIAERVFTIDSFAKNISLLEKRVENTYESLALEQQLGQLFMPAVGRNGLPFETVKLWAEDGIISGFMILGTDVTDEQIAELRELIITSTGIPPLVAIDAEPSLMQYRLPGYTFAETDTYSTVERSYKVGEQISEILAGKGINVNFAPVYDTNANDSVIGSRSYGANPQITASLANAFVDGSETFNIATTAKHFPGHGQVVGDSHKTLPTITGSLTELPGFISAINNDVSFVMIGHLNIDTEEIDTNGLPATLSREVMTDLLRNQLRFKRIVITDAFNMNALAGFPSKELNSIKAGADIVLMPEENIMTLIDLLYEEIQINPVLAKEVELKIKRVLEIRHTLR